MRRILHRGAVRGVSGARAAARRSSAAVASAQIAGARRRFVVQGDSVEGAALETQLARVLAGHGTVAAHLGGAGDDLGARLGARDDGGRSGFVARRWRAPGRGGTRALRCAGAGVEARRVGIGLRRGQRQLRPPGRPDAPAGERERAGGDESDEEPPLDADRAALAAGVGPREDAVEDDAVSPKPAPSLATVRRRRACGSRAVGAREQQRDHPRRHQEHAGLDERHVAEGCDRVLASWWRKLLRSNDYRSYQGRNIVTQQCQTPPPWRSAGQAKRGVRTSAPAARGRSSRADAGRRVVLRRAGEDPRARAVVRHGAIVRAPCGVFGR